MIKIVIVADRLGWECVLLLTRVRKSSRTGSRSCSPTCEWSEWRRPLGNWDTWGDSDSSRRPHSASWSTAAAAPLWWLAAADTDAAAAARRSTAAVAAAAAAVVAAVVVVVVDFVADCSEWCQLGSNWIESTQLNTVTKNIEYKNRICI